MHRLLKRDSEGVSSCPSIFPHNSFGVMLAAERTAPYSSDVGHSRPKFRPTWANLIAQGCNAVELAQPWKSRTQRRDTYPRGRFRGGRQIGNSLVRGNAPPCDGLCRNSLTMSQTKVPWVFWPEIGFFKQTCFGPNRATGVNARDVKCQSGPLCAKRVNKAYSVRTYPWSLFLTISCWLFLRKLPPRHRFFSGS